MLLSKLIKIWKQNYLKAFEDASANQKQTLNSLMTQTDVGKKVNGVKSVYVELDVKGKAELKMDEYYQIALKNFHAIQISEKKKQPLFELTHFLMGREE